MDRVAAEFQQWLRVSAYREAHSYVRMTIHREAQHALMKNMLLSLQQDIHSDPHVCRSISDSVLNLILTDTHADLNGYPAAETEAYFSSMRAALPDGWSSVHMSELPDMQKRAATVEIPPLPDPSSRLFQLLI